MKKVFKYIENIWIGNDGKPSIKRGLAILFSIDLLNTFHKFSEDIHLTIQAVYLHKDIDSQSILAIASLITGYLTHIGIEAGFIAGLLSLTTYQSLQTKQPYDSTPYQNVDQEPVPKVPIESSGS